MRFYSVLKKVFIVSVLVTLFVPAITQAQEYKWLKTSNYKEILVYADIEECGIMTQKMNETIKRTLMREGIKPTVTDSFVFQAADNNGESTRELLDDKLIGKNKIILHIYGKVIEYGSVFIYEFDIHFGVINNKYSQALLYATPRQHVIGADIRTGMDRAFRKLMKDAVADYVSANMK